MKLKHIMMAAAFAAAATTVSCSDDKFEPGPEPAAGNQGVCFIDAEPYYFVSQVDETYKATIYLHRNSTEGELTVPLTTLYKGDLLSIPSSAKFSSGEDTTSIEIILSKDAKLLAKNSFGIAVGEAYGDAYSDGPGLTQMYSYMTVAKSILTSFWLEDYNTYEHIGEAQDRYIIQTGDDQFQIPDFLDSGMTLNVNYSASNFIENKSSAVTVSSKTSEYYDDYTYWYFGDDMTFYYDNYVISELEIYKMGSTRYYYNSSTKKNQINLVTYAFSETGSGLDGYYTVIYTFPPES